MGWGRAGWVGHAGVGGVVMQGWDGVGWIMQGVGLGVVGHAGVG